MKSTTTLPSGPLPGPSAPAETAAPVPAALVRPDLVARYLGVSRDLAASVRRAEVSPEQARRFLVRIGAGLLEEQGTVPAG